MSHFECGCEAIVMASYSDRHNGTDHSNFELMVIPPNGKPYECAWYYDHQLTLVSDDRVAGEQFLQDHKSPKEEE